MNMIHDDKTPNKTKNPPVIRMGKEVSPGKGSDCDSGAGAKCADEKEKEKVREDAASSLV